MKASIEIHTDALLERKAKLEQALKNNEPVRARRITRSGAQWYTLDRQSIEKALSEIDSELKRRKEEDAEEDALAKKGILIKTHGSAAIEFFKLKVKEQELIKGAPLIREGKKKIDADRKRSKALKGKKFEDCPIDFFQIKEVVDMMKGVKRSTSEIGLFLFHGNKVFSLHRYTADSLSKAFMYSFKRLIAVRTWQNWKSAKYSKHTNHKRLSFAKKFPGY